MRGLAVIVPSRGRPQNVAELVEAWDETTYGNADLLVVVDHDDPELLGYLRLGLEDREPGMRLLVRPSPGSMVAALNAVAVSVCWQYDQVGFFGDDHRPRTEHWDAECVEALEKLGTGIVSGPDGFRADQLPTWCAMTSNIVRTLGYMAPPGLQHMYVDNAWQSLGEALGAYRYLPDVLVEHMHPLAGKAPSDEGYARVNSASVYARDEAAYVQWALHELRPAVEKIQLGAAPPTPNPQALTHCPICGAAAAVEYQTVEFAAGVPDERIVTARYCPLDPLHVPGHPDWPASG